MFAKAPNKISPFGNVMPLSLEYAEFQNLSITQNHRIVTECKEIQMFLNIKITIHQRFGV